MKGRTKAYSAERTEEESHSNRSRLDCVRKCETWKDKAYDIVGASVKLYLKVRYTQGYREEIDGIAGPCKPTFRAR